MNADALEIEGGPSQSRAAEWPDCSLRRSPLWERRRGYGSDEPHRNQRKKTARVRAACIAHTADHPRRYGFRNAVGGQDYPQQPAEDLRAKDLGGHERNDHIVAAQRDAEHNCKNVNREWEVRKKEKWNRRGHQGV